MGMILKLLVQIICLSVAALAIPVSLLEDIKDAQLQSPLRANKVKRAQEVLMFGNQQNRAVNTYGSPKQEKRDVGDNSLPDDVPTLPNIIPQMEEQGYDSNQLGAGEKYEKSYPYISREPNYGMLLRNAALKESLHNEPVLGYGDLSLYNMMDARRKRDVHKGGTTTKNSFRSKRDYDPYDLSPEEIISLMRLLESQRRQTGRVHDQRNNWPSYGTDSEDFDLPERHEENEVDSDSNFSHNGVWMDGPISSLNQNPHESDFWPRKFKRFMVSKRRSDEPLSQLNSPYDFAEGVPLQRRFIL